MMVNEPVAKGYFILVETGEKYPFMLNPGSLNYDKTVSYAQQALPGVSHPVYQYATGGPKPVTFDLFLDADLGLPFRGKGEVANALRPQKTEGTRTVQDDLDFLESLLYPTESNSRTFSRVAPSTLLFTMGTIFRGFPCVLTRAPANVTRFSPKMAPLTATVSITLEEIVSRGKSRGDVFRAVGRGGVR